MSDSELDKAMKDPERAKNIGKNYLELLTEELNIAQSTITALENTIKDWEKLAVIKDARITDLVAGLAVYADEKNWSQIETPWPGFEEMARYWRKGVAMDENGYTHAKKTLDGKED